MTAVKLHNDRYHEIERIKAFRMIDREYLNTDVSVREAMKAAISKFMDATKPSGEFYEYFIAPEDEHLVPSLHDKTP